MSNDSNINCCCKGAGGNAATGIHPTAIIEPGAQIGAGVTVEPYAVIAGDVVIGDGTRIGAHAVIGDGARIGDRCRIFPGAAISLDPQDKKYAGEKTLTIIGDDTLIREYVTINRGTDAMGETRVGKRGWIMAYCHIAHDCVLGDDVTISNGLAMAGHVTVGDHVTISGLITVNQFCRIGDYAMIGAQARISSDIAPYSLVGVEPLRIAGINKVKLERCGWDDGRIKNINRAYKILFRDGLRLSDALKKIDAEFPDDTDVKRLTDFIKSCERGFLRMRDEP